MVTATPQSELESNCNFYRSDWGKIAFKVFKNLRYACLAISFCF